MSSKESNLEIGRPLFFDLDKYLDSIEGMINADEVERAFWMLDNMPAYYRDHVPERALEIRESLHRQMYTPVQYKGIYEGSVTTTPPLEYMPGRAKALHNIVYGLNHDGKVPHIMEYAPGSFWIPKCLEHLGLKFTYDWKGLDDAGPAGNFSLPPEANSASIFVAFEIIEHLANEWEIYQNYIKFQRPADFVLLSTPLYTCIGGEDDWRKRNLGHLRTYTPIEFHQKALQMFKGYEWSANVDETIILTGKK